MRPLTLDSHVLLLDRFDAADQDLKDRIQARLLERTEVEHATGCMIYVGAWERNGHAKIRVGRRVHCVTRVGAWLYKPGFQLWDVRRVVHRPNCESPACYNPEHIVVVAGQAEALAAQMRMDRLGVHHRKLSKAKARSIRKRAGEGVPLADLAAEYGVSLQAIRSVIEGKTWNEDDEEAA